MFSETSLCPFLHLSEKFPVFFTSALTIEIDSSFSAIASVSTHCLMAQDSHSLLVGFIRFTDSDYNIFMDIKPISHQNLGMLVISVHLPGTGLVNTAV